VTKRHTANALAYEFYLKGLYNFDQRMTLTDSQMDATIEYFKNATDADPDFAAAHAHLAYAYAIKAVFQEPTEVVWAERARSEITRAQALDPQLPEIELARWQLLFSRYEGFQGEAAVRAILAAQRLDPEIGHAELGYLYTHLGLPDLAARALERALEIDPTSEFARLQMLAMYEMSGQYEEWLAASRRFQPNQPIDPLYFLGTGRLDEAERAIEAAAARDRFGQFLLLPDKAILAALKGDFRTAEAAIPTLLSRHPVKDPFYHHAAYVIARIYALEGKSGEAVKWVREAVASGFSTYALFERDAHLNRVRQAPEFIEFMSEMKATTDRYRREFGTAAASSP
jgi:tetratricopeptide (TPR) repeat protein